MIKQFDRVRLVTSRYEGDGVPIGTIAFVVEIYGPGPNATISHPKTGYELDFPLGSPVRGTIGVAANEVELAD
ncbi:MAG: hypothetical protein QOE92_1659 [Chloroflexota bacterium]|jgi:hypothetical protein|nr:hypothetical protein [Chloroflexota bacterium]